MLSMVFTYARHFVVMMPPRLVNTHDHTADPPWPSCFVAMTIAFVLWRYRTHTVMQGSVWIAHTLSNFSTKYSPPTSPAVLYHHGRLLPEFLFHPFRHWWGLLQRCWPSAFQSHCILSRSIERRSKTIIMRVRSKGSLYHIGRGIYETTKNRLLRGRSSKSDVLTEWWLCASFRMS